MSYYGLGGYGGFTLPYGKAAISYASHLGTPKTMRAILDALLPPGAIWIPKPGAGFDLFLEGMRKNYDYIFSAMKALADLRDPRKTPMLDDLEYEYGVVKNPSISEDERRENLAAIKYAKPGTGSDDNLETILQNAGFDVQVHQNDPAIDPADILQSSLLMVAGGGTAYAGFHTVPTPPPYASIAGLGGGELLVNGDIYSTTIDYLMGAGTGIAYAGFHTSGPPPYQAVAGRFDTISKTSVTYQIPESGERWNKIFFVGGEATIWDHFDDWNMDRPHTEFWTENSSPLGSAIKDKIASPKNSGIYALRITSSAAGVQIVEQLKDLQNHPLAWNVWSDGTAIPRISVNISPGAPAWILSWTGTATTAKQTGSFTAISSFYGIRLEMVTTSGGQWCVWDDIETVDPQIARAQIPNAREDEFKRLILKYKPMAAWAGLVVEYV